MNSLQISQFLSLNASTKPYFRGCFACDVLTSPSTFPSFLVSNTEEQSKTGQHWVLLYFPRKGEVEYFDSLGDKPNACIQRFLYGWKVVRALSRPVQSIMSNACGVYCLFFAVQRCNGRSFAHIERELQRGGVPAHFVALCPRLSSAHWL